MRLLNAFYRSAVLPVVERERHQGLARRLGELELGERASLESNRARQWDSLKTLLRHAYDSTPFYRQRFDEAGVHPSRIRSPEELQRIPPLTRKDLRDHLPALLSNRYSESELLRSATGGTTDTPVAFYRDREALRQKTAVQMRFDHWAGFAPGDKVFYLWGAQSD